MTADTTPSLSEQLRSNAARLNPLTQYGEDSVWRPATAAQGVMKEAASYITELEGLLTEAALLFRFYEASHLAKNTQEADEKAHRNAEIAGRIETALRKADQ